MRVSELEYSRTFNLGEYESERIGLKVTVEESENPFDVFKDTKALVISLHDEGKQIEESRKTVADLMGALARGTGILLAVMIIYKLYEEIAQQHMMDMHPMMRKFIQT